MGKRACLVPIMLILTMPAETPARLWGTRKWNDWHSKWENILWDVDKHFEWRYLAIKMYET